MGLLRGLPLKKKIFLFFILLYTIITNYIIIIY
nr:MAG TPA: small hydrophobic protein [Caudoviricetes sp.]